ncbi:hypothetical protein [Klebsiella sp. 141130]|uniref:hypothetical protein n=1 Tax=Klebsiella TaxID=570 RepID=UPI003D328050
MKIENREKLFMRNFIVALAFLSPVAAMANQWDLVCSGVSLSLTESARLNVVVKNDTQYAYSGGVNENDGAQVSVFNKYMPDVKVNDNNVIPVDANQRVIIEQWGVDGNTGFHLVDERGVHNCSVSSFKVGE